MKICCLFSYDDATTAAEILASNSKLFLNDKYDVSALETECRNKGLVIW